MTGVHTQSVGVIGAGAWGRNHVKTFYNLGNLTAVADSSPDQLASCHPLYPGVELYTDYRDLIQDEQVSAIVIASPAPMHAQMAQEAMLLGKHVLIEKPMTLNVEDAQRLTDIAEETGCVLMVGHLLLYDPFVLAMHKAIHDGLVGDVQSVHMERLKLGRVRRVENVLWSFAVHDLAVLLYLTGRRASVSSIRGQAVLQPHIEDDVYLHLSLGDNVQAHLHVSWLWPEQRRRTTLIGTSGMMVYDEAARSLRLFQGGIDKDLQGFDNGWAALSPCVPDALLFGKDLTRLDDSKRVTDITTVGPLEIECRHFLACCEQGVRPLSDGYQGIEVIHILDHAMRLAAEGDAT